MAPHIKIFLVCLAFSLGAVDEHLTPGNSVDGIAGVATGVGVGGASNR